jgi:2-polyprenyl-6-hydroxyphenyl methylase/3-demethylubiquinone-9 3-methyltransferase
MIPIVLQGAVMVVDEAWFHRARGLPRWERIGHPLDTLTIVVCLVWLVVTTPSSPAAIPVYVVLAVISTLFITKDEAVHARLCSPGEHWLHAVLFVLHPIVLAAFAYLWWIGAKGLLIGQLGVAIAFLAYQVIYWTLEAGEHELSAPERRAARRVTRPQPVQRVPLAQPVQPVHSAQPAQPLQPAVNNAWYADLGARWHTADDTPIALLRAEARHRNPWIAGEISRAFGEAPSRVLDLGCGGGLLSNYLAERGHRVTGVDTTAENLDVARAADRSGTARYELGDARTLPFDGGSFDVVCAMDLLEHVEQPARVIAEASRVLAPGGLFVFHTFNRTWQANLIVIKGVAWFVRNAPRDLHVLPLFVTPDELREMCRAHGLEVTALRGSRPRFGWPLWRMLLTGRVRDDFAFTATPSLKLGYTGLARKPLALCEPAMLGAPRVIPCHLQVDHACATG